MKLLEVFYWLAFFGYLTWNCFYGLPLCHTGFYGLTSTGANIGLFVDYCVPEMSGDFSSEDDAALVKASQEVEACEVSSSQDLPPFQLNVTSQENPLDSSSLVSSFFLYCFFEHL